MMKAAIGMYNQPSLISKSMPGRYRSGTLSRYFSTSAIPIASTIWAMNLVRMRIPSPLRLPRMPSQSSIAPSMAKPSMASKRHQHRLSQDAHTDQAGGIQQHGDQNAPAG